MKRFVVKGLFIALAIVTANQSARAADDSNRNIVSFDPGWRFALGEFKGAESDKWDDSGWRSLNIPHDWSIEGTFNEKEPSGPSGGFLPTGIGWYRKHFSLAQADASRRFFIQFDGVMENGDVWINGFHLGQRPFGYASFVYDMTGHLNFGDQENILAVRADNSAQPSSRWYSGAGIYRHVRLISTHPVHLQLNSVFISTPQITADQATVHVAAIVVNDSTSAQTVELAVPYANPDALALGPRLDLRQPVLVEAGKSAELKMDFSIGQPKRWDLSDPNLYRASVQLRTDQGRLLDSQDVAFGIREFEFKADTGFWLNGKNIKILGAALHHDAGALGAAVPLSAWKYRLNLLKKVGCNAIRTSHNPPSPEFLDLCDQMGFLVMDEMFDCWSLPKTSLTEVPLKDYSLYFKDWWKTDVTDTVCRDRNHPSVIIYSAGNEIHDLASDMKLSTDEFTGIRDVMHQLDPTRPVTMAVLRPNQAHVYDNGFAELMDVVGQNYRENEILAAHAAKPIRKILGTENHHELITWQLLRDNPAYSGQFIWTGFDYLGESRSWSSISHRSGFFDRTGAFRGQGYQRQSWWSKNPMVQIARVEQVPARPVDPADPTQPRGPTVAQRCDWTPKSLSQHDESVEVYSNCQQTELTLNGKSLGSQSKPADDSPRKWTVPFVSGEIKAIGMDDGKVVANCILRTAEKPAKIMLWVNQPSISNQWDDVAYVRATVTDSTGSVVPSANDQITFSITGPGVIAAVDSGSSASHESFRGNQRQAYEGTCIAIIRASADAGTITVTATADHLQSEPIAINATPR